MASTRLGVPSNWLRNRRGIDAPLIESIPNFSEGRRPDVVAALVEAITNVPGVGLLDQSSDADHNRSVVTFAGNPEAVLEAAFQGIAKAAHAIDLRQHEGVHPRVGAADVVPLVPLRGASMAQCVELAQRLGQRVGEELRLPVYLYEEAARLPERRRLEVIRRGGYAGLAARMAFDPGWQPDFGPAVMGPAGAVVIGARGPLIAFNVYLTTHDLAMAKAIARAVRESSGGLPAIKAMGVLVDGLAQVSLNLIDYTRTSLFTLLEHIHAQAQHRGVAIQRTELIGLIPAAALEPQSPHLTSIAPSQVLENRLKAIFP
jgi:glutamate formiminotransferase